MHQQFPFLTYFRGCVPGVVVQSYADGFAYIPGNLRICLIYCAALWYAQIIEYIMTRWSYSCFCTLNYVIKLRQKHYAHVSEGIELYASQIYSVEEVCLRFKELSETYFIQEMGLSLLS